MPLFEFKRRSTRRRWMFIGSTATLVAAMLFMVAAATASHPEVSLSGSNFEIDTNANLIVNDPSPSIDWLTGGTGTNFRTGVVVKADKASGSGDDSFGQGTKEDTAVPTVVSGSIPPNKSDLLNFGAYLETTASGARFLNLFWHRVQEPSGTTNMDFELNQSSGTSGNGVTPPRTAGDLLIQYDLAQGGTNPQLFLSRWTTTGAPATVCEASNSLPCWGKRDNLSAAGDAAGSINTTAIPANQAGTNPALGSISARTFGEAQVDFDALTGGAGHCTSFGSAYLKSRSSDSFTAALKDFIAPASVNINNCAIVRIRKQTDPDGATATFGYTKSINTDPATANTFTLQDGGLQQYLNVLPGTGYTVTEDVLPQGWDFVNVNCSASTGVTPQINGATVTFDIDASTDILDCTYNNRSRGTIIVEKITDDGQGAFDFSSGTLSPSPFTLTTTAAGAGGKDSRTFQNLSPGTYDVAETVPAGWNLVSSSCDDGSNPASIGLSGGETVTCTFHDARERGAILITKTAKHAAAESGEIAQSGVTFTVTGGSTPAGGVSGQTNAQGQLCLDNLVVSSLVGNYTVKETVPAGYHVVGSDTQSGIVVSESTCGSGAASVSFENTPLTDITVSVNSQVDGGTASTIDCVDAGSNTVGSAVTDTNGDGSASATDLEPGTYTCTIVIDP
jgi:hypothetical protein